MKIETQVINEITGAMKVVGENGPQSVIEYVVITCKSQCLWEKQTRLVRFLTVEEIEKLNEKMPLVLITVCDDYNCYSNVFVKPPDNQCEVLTHGHMTWEQFMDIIKNAKEVYSI
jgi:hypothetical protein